MDMRWVVIHYLIPLLFLMGILFLVGIKFINILYVFIGYFWVVTFLTAYSKEKIELGKYRYSTLKFLYLFNQSTQKITKRYLKDKYAFLNRGIPPIFFVLILWAITYSGHFWFVVIGYGYFEMIHNLFRKKFHWDPLRDNSEFENDNFSSETQEDLWKP